MDTASTRFGHARLLAPLLIRTIHIYVYCWTVVVLIRAGLFYERRHVQELRGHYVRRLPTPADISSRSPIVVTERDRQVLVAVHQQGFLTTDLVELAFFPPLNGSRSSASSKAYERLRELWLWGYLERVELPVARVLGGRRPFLYALGQQAVPLVESRLGSWAMPVQPRRLDRLDHVFVDHDLKAAALWANVRAQLRARRGCRWL
ncbi:MAG TPA: replication-relaxation family protein, partial [Chloroflexota bacterium]|nr:replication-relaxation family protein [Chloroflexota bacterium]